jgi:hypothetical protein
MSPAAGLVALLVAAAPAPERIRERAAEVLRAGGHQTALPAQREPPITIDAPWIDRLLLVLLVAALSVFAFLAISWLVTRLRGRARDVALPEAGPAAPPAPIAIESAEALAVQGRWAEAIHALLLDTLAALSRASRLAPSLTSREIVARVRIGPVARDALAGLVGAVEVSRFGGAEATSEDYRLCLDRFRAFHASYREAA